MITRWPAARAGLRARELPVYQALRVAGALLWIAVAAIFTGDHSQALLEERLDPLPILSADLSMCQVLLKPELCPGVIS